MRGGAARLRAAALAPLALLLLELAAVGALVASARSEGAPGPDPVPVVYDRPAEGSAVEIGGDDDLR